jgi:hypothetical protein
MLSLSHRQISFRLQNDDKMMTHAAGYPVRSIFLISAS